MDPKPIEKYAKPMSLRRKLMWGLLAGLALLIAIAAVKIGPLIFERNHYTHVVSIEGRPDFRDAQLMDDAWELPVARMYRRTSYEFQDNQSYCAPAALANVLTSLGKDTSQQQAIDGTRFKPWFGILLGGMTIDELADLTRLRIDRPVTVVRDPSLAEFRAMMQSTNDPALRFIANFHRGPIFGRGHGHFSPILGYLADRDLVLVGDVNVGYGPFLVSSERLWNAINTVDGETGKSRGLVKIVGPATQRAD